MKGLNRDMGMALGRQWHRHRIIENELKTCKAKQQGMALEKEVVWAANLS